MTSKITTTRGCALAIKSDIIRIIIGYSGNIVDPKCLVLDVVSEVEL
jgi:hypothetical protein